MKDIIKIAVNLTIVCVAAAGILGFVFAQTDHARKVNDERRDKEVVQGLLVGKTAPKGALKIYSVSRYVISDGETTTLGYLVPLKDGKSSLIQVDLTGKPVKVIPVSLDESKLADKAARDAAVNAALGKAKAVYAETFSIGRLDDKPLGYVVPGVYQGFKPGVEIKIALNPKFTVTGVEIVRSEEDPGLGDEIKKPTFRNQFVDKTEDMLKELKVIKEPLPQDYAQALDPAKAKAAGLNSEKITEIKQKHAKDDIYALTGATISSRALTNGVKDTVKKFVYRLDILNNAIKQQNVQAAF
jgi:Na+-translocating ferredoxin:NAD+ oxidoreductase subunit G